MRRNRIRLTKRLLPAWSARARGAIGLGLAALVASAGWVAVGGGRSAVAVGAFSAVVALGVGTAVGAAWERSRWSAPVRALARNLTAFNDDPDESWDLTASPPISELVAPVRELQARFLSLRGQIDAPPIGSDSGEMSVIGPISARMTKSGTFDPPSLDRPSMGTGEFSALDMISRLDPRTFRWLDSSLAEQVFLGWSLEQLKQKSFLDVVRDDDRRLAKQQLRAVLERGEGHGLVYRIATEKGETRAVELNIGVRYGADRRVLYLRCHLSDITAKLRDEGELRRRTLELTRANDDLLRANRKLEKLKDRYSDLYENAPAMYFTVDRRGRFLECNRTLVKSLGYPRKELLGREVNSLRPQAARGVDRFAEALRPGPIESECEWTKADGEVIAVWVTGSAIADADGRVRHARCVAQDVTARRRLEAELQVKNERLAVSNAELSRKNKELDEFTRVASHDLQEPLRTLIAFSEFLAREQSDRLDESGREYVRHLVGASKRLRSLIQDLLALSRAGRVAADFREVDLNRIVEVVRSDLAELVRSKDGEIRVPGPLPTAWGDDDRIGQLLTNLVGNGLKYNKSPKPSVEIVAKPLEPGRGVELVVEDNGIGIEPRFHDKIFRLFRRLHTREEYDGTGAGLTICQKIVEAHGGRIWVESEPGQGSTFHLTLPGPESRTRTVEDGGTGPPDRSVPHTGQPREL